MVEWFAIVYWMLCLTGFCSLVYGIWCCVQDWKSRNGKESSRWQDRALLVLGCLGLLFALSALIWAIAAKICGVSA